jgi:hypothetical protein
LIKNFYKGGLGRSFEQYGVGRVLTGHEFVKQLVRVRDGSMKLLYQPSVSPQARKKILEQLKYEKLHRRTDRIEKIAHQLNPKVLG